MTVRLDGPRNGLRPLPVLAALTVVGGVVIALLHLDRLPVVLCMFKTVTGRPCLSCGTTRALGRLGVLDVRGAFHMNPLAALSFLLLVALGAADAFLWLFGRSLAIETSSLERWTALVLGTILVLVNWAYLIHAGI